LARSDRDFTIIVDRTEQKIVVSFDASFISPKHSAWLKKVEKNAGLNELTPQPYWGFQDLYHKAETKLHNFFVLVQTKRINGKEFFNYSKISKLSIFSLDRFIRAIEIGDILIDFDARTGHNHGTKFKFRNNRLPELYEKVEEIV
jgi:hypothetical protein